MGRAFAAGLKAGMVVLLSGELGAGKTRFTRGICAAFGILQGVRSPSFNLENVYHGENITISHVDLYRVEEGPEAEDLDIWPRAEEGEALFIVEWGERLTVPPGQKGVVRVDFSVEPDGTRRIEVIQTNPT